MYAKNILQGFNRYNGKTKPEALWPLVHKMVAPYDSTKSCNIDTKNTTVVFTMYGQIDGAIIRASCIGSNTLV